MSGSAPYSPRCCHQYPASVPVYIMTTTCPDAHGIIHAITGSLLHVEANILEQEQYSDPDSTLFFARTRFTCDERDVAEIRSVVEAELVDYRARVTVRREEAHRRVLIMVSQYDHCLVDLLYRWRNGELPIDIVGVVSNHEVCRSIAEGHDLPFEELNGRIINIHHSFLPGFKGAKPYHQAHERGVKLIGATAHFVTADLDEGPIIEQQVHRVSHRDGPDQLAEFGRDVERMTLARAVRLFAEDRIFINGRGTVVLG